MRISQTRYRIDDRGKNVISDDFMSVEAVLRDILQRLADSSVEIIYSGPDCGISQQVTQDGITAEEITIYGSTTIRVTQVLRSFLRLTYLRRHPHFAMVDLGELKGRIIQSDPLRGALLVATGHEHIRTDELEIALALPYDEFLAAIVMAIETGEDVASLFVASLAV